MRNPRRPIPTHKSRPAHQDISTCVCGKIRYRSRSDAKQAMKAKHPSDNKMSAYECERIAGNWHYGHSHRKW